MAFCKLCVEDNVLYLLLIIIISYNKVRLSYLTIQSSILQIEGVEVFTTYDVSKFQIVQIFFNSDKIYK